MYGDNANSELECLTRELKAHRPVFPAPGVRVYEGWIDSDDGKFYYKPLTVIGLMWDQYDGRDPELSLVVFAGCDQSVFAYGILLTEWKKFHPSHGYSVVSSGEGLDIPALESETRACQAESDAHNATAGRLRKAAFKAVEEGKSWIDIEIAVSEKYGEEFSNLVPHWKDVYERKLADRKRRKN